MGIGYTCVVYVYVCTYYTGTVKDSLVYQHHCFKVLAEHCSVCHSSTVQLSEGKFGDRLHNAPQKNFAPISTLVYI